MERAVIHLNIADFAAAVETCRTPSLKGRPLIIAPPGAPRAVVYDMNEDAFRQGIRKGMPLVRVRRLHRDIRIIPPSFNRYAAAMKDLLKQGLAFTPLVESGSTDGHIFMDVTGSSRLFGPSVDVAFKLKKTFKKRFGLDPIWSVATNKMVAKVATRIVKPVGEYIVAPGEEEAFLDPLPVRLLPGLGKSDLSRLYTFNLSCVAQVKKLTPAQLEIVFEQRAAFIYKHLRGIDTSPVVQTRSACDTVRAGHEFVNDTNDGIQLKKGLYHIAEQVCRQVRSQQRTVRSATLILSYSDGVRAQATAAIHPPTACDMSLFKACCALLEKAWRRRVRIRHIRLACRISSPGTAVQGQLFMEDIKTHRREALTGVMDRIRSKFGSRAVRPALCFAGESGRS